MDVQVRLAIPSIATVGGYRGAVVYQYLKNRLIPYLKIALEPGRARGPHLMNPGIKCHGISANPASTRQAGALATTARGITQVKMMRIASGQKRIGYCPNCTRSIARLIQAERPMLYRTSEAAITKRLYTED